MGKYKPEKFFEKKSKNQIYRLETPKKASSTLRERHKSGFVSPIHKSLNIKEEKVKKKLKKILKKNFSSRKNNPIKGFVSFS